MFWPEKTASAGAWRKNGRLWFAGYRNMIFCWVSNVEIAQEDWISQSQENDQAVGFWTKSPTHHYFGFAFSPGTKGCFLSPNHCPGWPPQCAGRFQLLTVLKWQEWSGLVCYQPNASHALYCSGLINAQTQQVKYPWVASTSA